MRTPTMILPCVLLAMPALGDMPKAMDRVPANAAAIVGVPNLSQFHSDLSGIGEMFGGGKLDQPLQMAQMLLSTPGLDASGSAALVFMPDENGVLDFENTAKPTMFAVLPVTSYDEMVGAFEGDPAAAVAELTMQGESVFAVNLGGGFCAIAPEAEDLAGLGDARGTSAGHAQRVGAVGQSVIDGSDIFVAVDIKAFAPTIESAMDEMRSGMEMAQMMMGEQGAGMAQMIDTIDGLKRQLIEDGGAAVVGMGISESGLSLDASAQFREGSEIAELASRPGNATGLLNRVPDMPFLVAFSMDLSSPQLKEWMVEMSEAAMAMQGEGGQPNPMNFMNFGEMGELMDLHDGSAFVMGNPPSMMMGGMFHSMVEFKASSEPQKLVEATRQMVAKMDGMSQGGITFNATADAGVKEIAGRSIDTWSMRMTPDPEDPTGGQMAMAFSMIFGPNGGPAGYYTAVDSGMITTMAQNDQLMADAIEAATSGNGLASGEKLSAALAHQPEGSIVQGFVDVGLLGKQFMQMAAMMGPQAPQFTIPDNLAPIGMSLATGSGGLHGRLHVPQGLLNFVADMQEQFGGAGAEGEGEGPRF